MTDYAGTFSIGSVQLMSGLCQMVSCSTLSALAAACRKLTLS